MSWPMLRSRAAEISGRPGQHGLEEKEGQAPRTVTGGTDPRLAFLLEGAWEPSSLRASGRASETPALLLGREPGGQSTAPVPPFQIPPPETPSEAFLCHHN